MSSLRDEALISTDALQAFVEEWGDMADPYNRLVLEVVLEELFDSGISIIEKNQKVLKEENGSKNS